MFSYLNCINIAEYRMSSRDKIFLQSFLPLTNFFFETALLYLWQDVWYKNNLFLMVYYHYHSHHHTKNHNQNNCLRMMDCNNQTVDPYHSNQSTEIERSQSALMALSNRIWKFHLNSNSTGYYFGKKKYKLNIETITYCDQLMSLRIHMFVQQEHIDLSSLLLK